MPEKKRPQNIQQTAIGDGNVQIVGDQNVVNQTIVQKFFNIFKSDAETVDQRNRRIMLGHVENFWVKGILEKSLHGAAMLELGIKEDPDVLTYPWAIKRESNKDTLPAGTSMLEIFNEIGMGRSLLILGAPGSGKTTMLLELTRQLIERAREDVTEPIPVVFNLSSWTEKLTLADWLARELNNMYYVPKKIAPTWIRENKMLLLLDGLDEVKQESRDKCVDAINEFRKENGLTSMGICSRTQDYVGLKAQLSFDGAVEIQPLTSKQVNEYFRHFGKELAGIRHALERDMVMLEMAETPLFLSIMTLAFRDTDSKNILISANLDIQRKYLFDTYVGRMFERPERSQKKMFKKQDTLRWLPWLAKAMIEQKEVLYSVEDMQPTWLGSLKQLLAYGLTQALIIGLIIGFVFGISFGQTVGIVLGLIWGLSLLLRLNTYSIQIGDTITWSWNKSKKTMNELSSLDPDFKGFGLWLWLVLWLSSGLCFGLSIIIVVGLFNGLQVGLLGGLVFLLIYLTTTLVSSEQVEVTTRPGQRLINSIRTSLAGLIILGLLVGLVLGRNFGLSAGLFAGYVFGGLALIQHYLIRFILSINKILPWRLIPFLDHCVDLIFLRRVGGGYIFVHRLLMEHFADMYPADEK